MSPLQYFRWRLGTRRAAEATIRHIERGILQPRALVDAGARKSEFMRYLVNKWPFARVLSFEPDERFMPLGEVFRSKLGTFTNPLAGYPVPWPSLLKIDCDLETVDVLRSANLTFFQWVVVEVMEEGLNNSRFPPNNRSEINRIMEAAGFKESMAVDATVCILNESVAQTDVLFWRTNWP